MLDRRLGEACALLRSRGVEPKTAHVRRHQRHLDGPARRAAAPWHRVFVHEHPLPPRHVPALTATRPPTWWENAAGQRLLVWNGEHYNLGNVLGLRPNRTANFMMQNFGADLPADPVEALRRNLDHYLDECEQNGYPYDFILASVSACSATTPRPSRRSCARSKATPPDTRTAWTSAWSACRSCTRPSPQTAGHPVYRGDLTDWWANGVGSAPYAVKHYREAQPPLRAGAAAGPGRGGKVPRPVPRSRGRPAAVCEHTWGHSSTITDPCDTMVLDLDMRKNSYASKAHEAASRLLGAVTREKGDTLRYYNTSGTLRVLAPGGAPGPQLVEFTSRRSRCPARASGATTGPSCPARYRPPARAAHHLPG